MEIDMHATLRRVMRVLLAVAMLVGVGTTVGASMATAASNTPPVPTSTVSVNGDTATYCVANYAPNSTVSVVNQANGATGTIHTDGTGAGCTTLHVDRSCTQTLHETITATGVDASNHPATSQAIADVPAGGTGCGSSTPTPSPTDECPSSSQLTLSIYVAPQGTVVRATACGFRPGESADGFVFSTPKFLGTTTADADGVVTMRTRIPNCIPPGQHTFQLVGETSNHSASAQFSVTKSAACPNSGGGGNGGVGAGGGVLPTSANQGGGPTGGLAFTGANILLMILIALVLLALGILAVATVRRRRAVSAA